MTIRKQPFKQPFDLPDSAGDVPKQTEYEDLQRTDDSGEYQDGDEFGLRIPVETDHPFQCKPITDSIPSRSPIPVEADH